MSLHSFRSRDIALKYWNTAPTIFPRVNLGFASFGVTLYDTVVCVVRYLLKAKLFRHDDSRLCHYLPTVAVYKYFHSFIMPAFVSYFRLLEELADRPPASGYDTIRYDVERLLTKSTTWLLTVRSIDGSEGG